MKAHISLPVNDPFYIQTEGRECGDCSLCCKVKTIKLAGPEPREVLSKTGEWCKHCTTRKSCDMYSSRPLECSDYQCSWLEGIGEERDKPSRSGIVINTMNEPVDEPGQERYEGLSWIIAESYEGAIHSKAGSRIIEKLSKMPWPIYCHRGQLNTRLSVNVKVK